MQGVGSGDLEVDRVGQAGDGVDPEGGAEERGQQELLHVASFATGVPRGVLMPMAPVCWGSRPKVPAGPQPIERPMRPLRPVLQPASMPARVASWTLGAALCVALLVAWVWSGRGAEADPRAPSGQQAELLNTTAERAAPLVARADVLRLAVVATALADLTGGRVAVRGADGSVLVDTRIALEPAVGPASDHACATVDVVHAGQRVGELMLWQDKASSTVAFPWSLVALVFLCTMLVVGIATVLAHRAGATVRAATTAVQGHLSGRPVRLPTGRVPASAELAALDRAVRQLEHAAPASGAAAAAPVLDLAHRLVVSLERQHLLVQGHAERTARHATVLAERLGLIEDDRRDLDLACRLHELGKAWLRPGLLRKEGVWDDSDRDSLRNHPARAAALLESVACLRRVAAIVRSQCERHDGAGWPDGLRGDRIPLGARILAVAARFDLIRCGIHGWALGTEAAVEQLRELRGSELDPWLVDLFAEAVQRAPGDEADKTVSLGMRGVNASYLGAAAQSDDGVDAEGGEEIELMADGTAREGT